jgi:regulator of protease activity HflC (stomatin/prohibitin superfamily)
MASITRWVFAHHLRAEPNQFILHFRRGRLVRQGIGLAYWFSPLSASVAQVPAEDCETTFVLSERCADFQSVTVQCTVTYRISDPERAALRTNFSIALASGAWLEKPLERIAALLAQRAQHPARTYLMGVPIVEAARAGASLIQPPIEVALRADPELEALGIQVVSVQIDRVAPAAELEKAIQTPAREAIQQRADEAVFERRAFAVEKERTIKENELATELELARRQEQLIQQQGANARLQAEQEAEADRLRSETESRRHQIVAEGQAQASRLLAAAAAEAEERRVELYRGAPADVALGLALQEFARHVQSIQHLNLTPDLVGAALQQFLRERAGE